MKMDYVEMNQKIYHLKQIEANDERKSLNLLGMEPFPLNKPYRRQV